MPGSRPFSLFHPAALAAAVALWPLTAGVGQAQGIGLPDAAVIEAQMAEFNAAIPGSIWAMNPLRNGQVATGADGTTYRLTSLNPNVNSWFVIEVAPPNGRARSYHLENADPAATQLSLVPGDAPALRWP